ncbi:membrane protein [Polymorphobacter glacialis]|uniref:Membrane protein n=1 Tax=Sandarakinorhabdus glacialis TaxID=1614636 RepID=A0A917A1S4_9SPHN|nr:DUF2244 domain-containing protein [Polymorphobacter glacialis]GGE21360.1 membrane protein [Polymorphobacter glacialis]
MPPVLDLTLTPNRSLSTRHMRWVVGSVGGVFLVSGLRFLALGAWPILPFLFLDVALLWWAFRASTASGRGHERVVLADDALTLHRVSPQGTEKRFGFEPFFTRVQIEETALGDAHVYLAARGRRVSVGSFLSAPERRQVGAAIAAALTHYRS